MQKNLKKRIFEIIAGLIISWMVFVSITITINSLQRDHENFYDNDTPLELSQAIEDTESN